MKVVLRRDPIANSWSLEVLEAVHNYGPSAYPTAHPAHRIHALDLCTQTSINTLARAGLPPAQILITLRVSNPGISLILKDVANLTYQERLRELNGRTLIQWLLEVSFYLLIYSNTN
jgi:hypothetical protein